MDIRFWIVLFFLARLYGITLPPLEVAHNWRQTDVSMVARNFLESDANIFFPRIDIAGEKSGITGMEFPLLNYLIYLVSRLFGYQHWYGRLINLMVSSVGIYYFYLLIRKYFEPEMAFRASIILLFSLWFMYSRKVMPDTFALSLVLISLYYGSEYLHGNGSITRLLLYGVLLCLGVLSKLPAALPLFVLPVFLLDKKIILTRKMVFALITLLSLAAPFTWYFYWVPSLVREYGFWHFFMGKSIGEGLREVSGELPLLFEQFYSNAVKFIGFGMFLTGLVFALIRRQRLLLAVFTLCLAGFLFIILKSGTTFTHHSYYMIPFVPVMALMAAFGLGVLPGKRTAILVLLAISVEGIANQVHDFRIKPDYAPIVKLEHDLDQVSRRSDLIIINSRMLPTPMYFAHRKGWVDFNERIADTAYIRQLQSLGLKNIVILKRAFGTEIQLPYRKLVDNQDYAIYTIVQ